MTIFQSTEQRVRFVKSLGAYYAGLGGLFGAYREARPAFENAIPHNLYKRVGLVESDYPAFEEGFVGFQKYRTVMMEAKRDAEAVMRGILKDEGVDLLGIGHKVKEYKDVAEMIEAQG